MKATKTYYRSCLCFVRCSKYACIPKELDPGMFELRTAHSVTVLPNDISEIALDIMILLPVDSYTHFTLAVELAKLGLLLLNSIHLESDTGIVTLIVKNLSTENVIINKYGQIATMILNSNRKDSYFCIESYQLTRSPHELNTLYDVCKAKEDNTLLKI